MEQLEFLRTATIDIFEPLVNSAFYIRKELFNTPLNEDISFILEKAEKLKQHPYPNKVRDSFSLIFTGPLNTLLPQGTYPINNEKLEEFPLFIVPLGDKDGKMYYQAILN